MDTRIIAKTKCNYRKELLDVKVSTMLVARYLLMSDLGIHELQHLKLGVQIRPRTRTLTRRLRLLTPPIRDLRAFRLSPSTGVSCWRLALAVLGDARTANAVLFVVAKHAASIAVEPPPTSSLERVALWGLRRLILLSAQFTFRTRHASTALTG
ncbi:unnamed protein product [Ectocarpus sp. CCAP 1310/34]|nr:unnamed protein product [Ectocarpus sp. CCAP 1310/34]